MVKIDISSTTAGINEVNFRSAPEDLDLNPDEFTDIEVMARLDVGDSQILANVQVSGNVNLVCDRTLVTFMQPIAGGFTVVFSKKSAAPNEDDEMVIQLDPATRELDVTRQIRDTLLLSIPLRHVAPEAVAAELVLSYGNKDDESSVDPRWEALRPLSQRPER